MDSDAVPTKPSVFFAAPSPSRSAFRRISVETYDSRGNPDRFAKSVFHLVVAKKRKTFTADMVEIVRHAPSTQRYSATLVSEPSKIINVARSMAVLIETR
ncbi:hypothetical protein GWI33_012791 [Rhynchophorus ferrugineus]|uniref:Uncharacterized protein n=1 Tax=Rhynchophorus ferrugineus TaxID=354439 RepID=A0A834II54_RHYFE|nr:hypothetical protein GWI33_012791 [Rhynchophorus ferrugineus]